LVLEGRDWTPTENVYVEFHATSAGAHWDEDCCESDLLEGCVNQLGPEVVQECRNFLYAMKGYHFKSKKLRDLFYSGDGKFHDVVPYEFGRHYGRPLWGRGPVELRSFKDAWFSREDRRVLKLLDRIEKANLAELQAKAKGSSANGGAVPKMQNPEKTLERLPPLLPEVDSGIAVPSIEPSSAASPKAAPPVSAAPNAGDAPSAAPSAADATAVTQPGGKCDCSSVGAEKRPLSSIWGGLLVLWGIGVLRRRSNPA
jgi:hypothetical protein